MRWTDRSLLVTQIARTPPVAPGDAGPAGVRQRGDRELACAATLSTHLGRHHSCRRCTGHLGVRTMPEPFARPVRVDRGIVALRPCLTHTFLADRDTVGLPTRQRQLRVVPRRSVTAPVSARHRAEPAAARRRRRCDRSLVSLRLCVDAYDLVHCPA
jgi:hypothetical protein